MRIDDSAMLGFLPLWVFLFSGFILFVFVLGFFDWVFNRCLVFDCLLQSWFWFLTVCCNRGFRFRLGFCAYLFFFSCFSLIIFFLFFNFVIVLLICIGACDARRWLDYFVYLIFWADFRFGIRGFIRALLPMSCC